MTRLPTLFAVLMYGFGIQDVAAQPSIDAETPHGALLQQIAQESDAIKKLQKIDEFLGKFANQKAEVQWVLRQKQELHNQASDWDPVVATGEKILAGDPEALDVAVKCLKAVEAKKDAAAVLAWADRTSGMARRSVTASTPRSGEDAAAVKVRIDYAQQVAIYADYALFNQAIQPGNAAQTVQMTEALRKQSPTSPYVAQVMPSYILALTQTGQKEKAISEAEEYLTHDPSNDDLLILVADHYFNMKPKPDKGAQDKVILYAGKAVDVWGAKQKPAAVSDADWDKKKQASLGYAQWIHGMTLGAQNRQAETDKSLRAALPLLTNDQMKAGALFYLGLVNYQMGEATKNKVKIAEAAKFNAQCAAIKSPYQPQAAQNQKAIAAKYGIR